MFRVRTWFCAILCGIAFVPALAGAQTPFNRAMHRIAVWPHTGSESFDISAVWTFDVEPSMMTYNLGTRVELWVNGTLRSVKQHTIAVPPIASPGCIAAPACSGGGCGSAVLDGGSVSMLCYKDGPCTPTLCDCDCGYWVTTEFPSEPLAIQDEITVILYPLPGAMPDADVEDDQLLTTVTIPVKTGWNRAVHNVAFVETSRSVYTVHVEGSVGWESQPGYLNLDTRVELWKNGSMIAFQNVPVDVNGYYDQTCFQQGCGTECGSVNGLVRTCHPYIWWDCGCFGGLTSEFPGVPLTPGDEITVILWPGPGALPELPPTRNDDRLILGCCPTGTSVATTAGEPAPSSLFQNQPNPFGPLTSIQLAIAQGGPVRVEVFDASGRHVRALLDRTLAAGNWSVAWDGRNESGELVSPGTYFYRLTTRDGAETRRMTLVR